VGEIIARQEGVLSRAQAVSAGLTPGQIRHRLTSGRWMIVHPSVYRSTEHPVTQAARVRSAGLWGGANALLSGVAAAWWWGLPTPIPREVEVVIPLNEHRRSRPGTRIVRRNIPPQDSARFRGAPVTSLALSVMVASVQLGRDGPAVMDRALQTTLTMAELRACYYRNLGMAGSRAAGDLIRAAADKSAAASERVFLGLLKSAGIRGWRVNYRWDPSDPRTIDVAFVAERVAIEIDGWAWHSAPDRFQRDRTKQNDLMGWTVLRFTWFDLSKNPDDVIRRVRAALRQSAATRSA
jgi:very-short-patch-repair endonuclease